MVCTVGHRASGDVCAASSRFRTPTRTWPLLSCQHGHLRVILARMTDSDDRTRFAGWLAASMSNRGLSQAQLARAVGVADTQVSRWRRGQVVPTVQYLQRIADTFGVERITLDELVGLPIAQGRRADSDAHPDPELEAELQAHQARLR